MFYPTPPAHAYLSRYKCKAATAKKRDQKRDNLTLPLPNYYGTTKHSREPGRSYAMTYTR